MFLFIFSLICSRSSKKRLWSFLSMSSVYRLPNAALRRRMSLGCHLRLYTVSLNTHITPSMNNRRPSIHHINPLVHFTSSAAIEQNKNLEKRHTIWHRLFRGVWPNWNDAGNGKRQQLCGIDWTDFSEAIAAWLVYRGREQHFISPRRTLEY